MAASASGFRFHTAIRAAVLMAVLAVWTSPAAAFLIDPDNSGGQRELDVQIDLLQDPADTLSDSYFSNWSDPDVPPTGYGTFNDTGAASIVGTLYGGTVEATAAQDSTVSGNALFGSGSSTIAMDLLAGDRGSVSSARSSFDLDFVLTERVSYDLTGMLSSASFLLNGPGISFSTSANAPFASSGFLEPGSYHIQATTGPVGGLLDVVGPATVSEMKGWDFDFSVVAAPVPEPATGLLLGAGLVAWAAVWSRRA